eukprot:CAMPEP_0183715822 /NCGR_PEP_ID=MMETSP0737-20130205/9921_1 /TAXON_ID=385413 /ORGANISM="Thalassiosira miniscula, Strain CCMP1093" /LENGTH=91 /DNA_ID=CAMNT_0025944981 /DNA_START=326 /DNA_END=601 /DNA_ORIENTATION=-
MADFAEMNIHETSAFLGLENYLLETTIPGIENMRRALTAAVLSEQYHQFQSCKGTIYNAEKIANISKQASKWSRDRAKMVALIHAEEQFLK